jgi:hydrogenase assembly chaperone HypC/HupF
MEVVEARGRVALCRGRDGLRELDLALVGEQPPGTWVLAFIDAAREVIDAQTAGRIDAALDGLEAALAGETDLGPYFADLVDRTPQLPPHLRGAATSGTDCRGSPSSLSQDAHPRGPA